MSLLINGELVLYGEVGDGWWGDYFTATQVLEALAEHGSDKDLTVRINSPGGLAYDGVAIFNALKSHQGKVTINIDGMAMSAASVIAMAGDEIVMREGAVMMIHDPMTMAWGNVSDFSKAIDGLDKLAEQMAGVYSRTSGQTKEECREIMKEETYFDSEEAVAFGFAHSTDDADLLDPVAFDYRTYSKAPEALKLVAKQNDWTFRRPSIPKSAASAAPTSQKEKSMTDKQKAAELTNADLDKVKADAVKAERDRRQAVTAGEHYKGNEAQAEHMLNKTELSAEDINASLALVPKAVADDGKGPDSGADPEGYDKGRTLAGGLAKPSGGQGKTESGLSNLVSARVKKMRA